MELIKPKKVVVKRSQWVRGTGNTLFKTNDELGPLGETMLRQRADHPRSSKDGFQRMCCLGFYCLAAGLDADFITCIESPHTLRVDEGPVFVPGLISEIIDGVAYLTPACSSAISVNDSEDLDDAARESRLTEIMKKIGVEMVFED